MGVQGGWSDGRRLMQGQGDDATPEAAAFNSMMTVGQRLTWEALEALWKML